MTKLLTHIVLLIIIGHQNIFANEISVSQYDKAWHIYKKAIHFKESNIDSALVYVDSCYTYNEILQTPRLKNKCDLLYAELNRKKLDYSKALFFAQNCISFFKSKSLYAELAECYFISGFCKSELTSFNEAIQDLNIAINLYDSLGMEYEYYITLNTLASNLFYLKKYKLSKNIFKEIYEYSLQQNDNSLLALSLNNLAIIYSSQGGRSSIDTAIFYYKKAIEVAKKLGDKEKLSNSLMNLSTIYADADSTDLALKTLYEANKINGLAKSNIQSIYIYYNLATIYFNLNHIDSCLFYLNKCDYISTKENHLAILPDVFNTKAIIYEEKKNYKKAYKYLTEATKWKDSIWEQNLLAATSEIENRYDNKQKINELNLKQVLIEKQESKLNEQKIRNIGFGLSAIMFFLMLIIIYAYSRKLKKINRWLKQKNNLINDKNQNLKETINIRDQLISIIAHDIKNPLAAITGFAELITIENEKEPKKIKSYANHILHSSSSLFELLENLLKWAKTQRDGLKTNPEMLNVSELINSSINLLEHTANSKKITINNHCKKHTMIYADKPSVSTIFRNIISNALKFTSSGGKVDIYCDKYASFTQIKIQDNGIGIQKEDIPKLFDSGAKRDSIGSKENKGFGLGLLLCDEFIKLNKGFIKVKSIFGKGSTFIIYLPRYY